MREYIITISVVALIASIIEIFAPSEWEKYVKLSLGLVILSIMISPISELKKEKLVADAPSYRIREEDFYDDIAVKLKNNIERDIEERMKNEFNIEAKAKVDIEVDENHNIKGVNAIRIYSHKKSEKMMERLEEIYGCSRIEIGLQ